MRSNCCAFELAELSACCPRSLEDLVLLFQNLGYCTEPTPIAKEHHPLWALDDSDVQLTWVASLSARHRGFQVVLVERSSEGLNEDYAAWQTRWAGRLWRRNRAFRGILVCASPDWSEVLLSAVMMDGIAERPGLRHIRLTTDNVRPDTWERFQRLAVKPSDTGPEVLARRLAEDLDLVHVTRSFYGRFRQARDQLAEAWLGLSDEDEAARQELALLTLSRLLFLYFLQRKRLLDAREDFLRDTVRAVAAEPQSDLYRDLLQPLFFGVLNTPKEQRTPAAKALGQIPYLNGGLFEPCALEMRYPELDLPNSVVLSVFRRLLERYTFTIREDGQGLGVDPEMLGRVFEGLMSPEARGGSGTFFTPRALVDTLVHQALCTLLQRLGVVPGAVRALMRPDVVGVLPIAPEQAADLREQLEHVSILDPACGSGAFLVGVLTQLEQLHRRLAMLSGAAVSASLRRDVIRQNIYGIDINPSAVRLCELRLWLAILDETGVGEEVKPLPNLDHRVRQGDALLEPLDWSETAGDLCVVQDAVAEMEALKLRYAQASSNAKTYMRTRLHDAELDLFHTLAQRQITRLETEQAQLTHALDAPTLVPVPKTPPRQLAKAKKALAERLCELQEHVEQIEHEGQAPGFSPTIHFPEVMSRGGFDLIIGNPPWVRIHAISPARRALLKRRYISVREPAWTAGGMLRHLKGFGGQADLSVCFVERALGLLKPQGVLGFWLPSKLMKALYGGGIRKLLMTQARPVWLGELGSGHFAGATTYPCAVLAIKGVHPPNPKVVVEIEGEQSREIALEHLRWDKTDVASPWIATSLAQTALQGRPIGKHPHLRVCRGVMTGFNQAFIVTPTMPVDDLDPAYLLPLLRGREVSAWSWRSTDRIVWTHDTTEAAPLAQLPETLRCYLAPMRERLEKRSDIQTRREHRWWRIFRAGPHILSHRVVWRDMGTRLEAVAVPARDADGQPIIPLNTVYYIPTPTYEQALLLAAWLNASVVRRCAHAVAERASGGYRRFFSWVISLLPLPTLLDRALGPDFDAVLAHSPELSALLELSRALHLDPQTALENQHRLDTLVEALYRQPAERVCTSARLPWQEAS